MANKSPLLINYITALNGLVTYRAELRLRHGSLFEVKVGDAVEFSEPQSEFDNFAETF